MPEKSKKSQEKKMETNQQNQDEIEIEWNFDDIFSEQR